MKCLESIPGEPKKTRKKNETIENLDHSFHGGIHKKLNTTLKGPQLLEGTAPDGGKTISAIRGLCANICPFKDGECYEPSLLVYVEAVNGKVDEVTEQALEKQQIRDMHCPVLFEKNGQTCPANKLTQTSRHRGNLHKMF